MIKLSDISTIGYKPPGKICNVWCVSTYMSNRSKLSSPACIKLS